MEFLFIYFQFKVLIETKKKRWKERKERGKGNKKGEKIGKENF